jgi:hypothetical protein
MNLIGASASASSLSAQALSGIATRGGLSGLATGGDPVLTTNPLEAGFSGASVWSADAATEFATIASIRAKEDSLAIGLPIRAVQRRLYFALWFDAPTAAATAGEIQFIRENNTVATLPFNISRTGLAGANSGFPLPAFDAWALDPADTFVVPAAGDLSSDALFLCHTGASLRYVTTLSPLHLRLSADTARVRFWTWSVTGTSVAFLCHLAVASDS